MPLCEKAVTASVTDPTHTLVSTSVYLQRFMSWTNGVTKEPEDYELHLSFGLINGDAESEVESA